MEAKNIHKKTCYNILVHVMTEAEEACDVQSPSRRPGKVNGRVSRPESWRANGVDFSPGRKA